MTGLDVTLSVPCNRGLHEQCSGEPPSEAMRPFLAEHLSDKRCACPCHARSSQLTEPAR